MSGKINVNQWCLLMHIYLKYKLWLRDLTVQYVFFFQKIRMR